MNEDMKYGYNVCGQRLNEEIDTMIDEIHSAYMRNTDERTKDRLDSQIKILWNFKDRIENAIADGYNVAIRNRTIQVAVKYIEEVPEGMSDEEIDEYLKSKYPDKEFQWCDGDQDVFEDF